MMNYGYFEKFIETLIPRILFNYGAHKYLRTCISNFFHHNIANTEI